MRRPYLAITSIVPGQAGIDLAPETSVAVWHWVLTECRAPAVGPSQPAGLGLGPTVLQKPVAKKNTDELSFIGLSVEWLSTTLLR